MVLEFWIRKKNNQNHTVSLFLCCWIFLDGGRWITLQLEPNKIAVDLLKIFETTETYSPKWWFDGDLQWYKVKKITLNKSKYSGLKPPLKHMLIKICFISPRFRAQEFRKIPYEISHQDMKNTKLLLKLIKSGSA